MASFRFTSFGVSNYQLRIGIDGDDADDADDAVKVNHVDC
jgi:hypothetical protein